MTDLLYWDDFKPGLAFDLGSYFLSEDELIDFATAYDPQTFHTDPVKAKDSAIGCLCASGVQTVAIAQRLTVDQLFSKTAIVAGMGVDKLRFHKPVLANETLTADIVVLKAYRAPGSKNRGIVTYKATVNNPRDEKVASLQGTIMVLCRPTSLLDNGDETL